MFLNLIKDKLFIWGGLSALAFAPTYLLPFAFYAFFLLLEKLFNNADLNQSFKVGWIFGVGHFIVSLYWMNTPLTINPYIHGWLIPFNTLIIPSIVACYIGLTCMFVNFIWKYCKKHIKSLYFRKLFYSIIFATSWVFSEYLRSYLFSGFPWNLAGYIFGFSDHLLQIAAWIKIYGLSLLAIIFFTSPFVIINDERKIKSKKHFIPYVAIIAFMLCIGFMRLHNFEEEKLNINVRIVQPNFKELLNLNRNKIENQLVKILNLSKSKGYENVDLFIWPESGVRFPIYEGSKITQDIAQNILNHDAKLITGGVRIKKEGNKIVNIYNSMFLIANDGTYEYYDKIKLVPFGEFIPMKKFFPFVNRITNGSMDFTRGESNGNLSFDSKKIMPLICYEAIFPHMAKNRGESFIVNITNDAWFGRTSAPYQHLLSARLRAIESGLPLIRSANTGISAIVDSRGRILREIGLNKEGFLDFEI